MPGGTLLADDQPSVSVIDHERLESVDASSSSPGRGARIATLTSLVVILELLFFRGAFLGTVVPPWDFVGSYTTDAYYWTLHGSFFSPVAWVPTTWAGYPGAAILQNGAWYLPTELVSAVWP